MKRFPTHSVRFRVTGIATLIVASVLVVVAVAIVVVQHRVLTAAVDDGLRRRADDLATAMAVAVPGSLAGTDDDSAAQLTTESGAVVVSSSNLGDGSVIGVVPVGDSEMITRQVLVEDDAFRVLSRRVETTDGPLVLHVATATDEVSDSVAALRSSLVVAIPLTVVVLAVTIWMMVGRALHPVEEIRREVDAITESDLARRVPVPETDDEIERLATTMNRMLGRLEGGVARIQQFVADASHELRSPLTRIRSELEVDLASPISSDMTATHASVLDETIAMEDLVGDLLFLARSDAGRQLMRTETVDLDDLLVAEARRQHPRPSVRVDISGVSAGQVSGDRAQLRRMIGNLVSNAVRFAASTVSLTLGEEDESVVLTVADDGPGIGAADREIVFERFARRDEGRARDDGGSGLGLAIVGDIVDRHGGKVAIDPNYSGGTRLVVRLPRAANR